MLPPMSFPEILLIAISVALDAAVVAVGAGVLARVGWVRTLKIAGFFGGFQVLMPLLGFLLGSGFREPLLAYGHIIGFVLLMLVGGKMVLEAFETEDTEQERDIAHTKTLLFLAFATSIDAFVVGVTFNFIDIHLLLALTTIGVVTFLMALLGVYIGKKGKHLLGNRVELVGATIIILLAFKVLLTS